MQNTTQNTTAMTRRFSTMPDDQPQHSGAASAMLRPGTKSLRILVVDDHDIIRRGLRQLLTARQGWEVCGEAKTGREAATMAEQMKPDIVVMDVSMPDLNGLEAARRIHKEVPKTGILILTMHFSHQLIREVHGQNQDPCFWNFFVDSTRCFQTVQIWHAHVHHDDVRFHLLSHRRRFAASLRLAAHFPPLLRGQELL